MTVPSQDSHAPLQIQKACPKSWDELTGAGKQRFCSSCSLHVHDAVQLTQKEAEAIVSSATSRVCMRLQYDAAGQPIYSDTRADALPAAREPQRARAPGALGGVGRGRIARGLQRRRVRSGAERSRGRHERRAASVQDGQGVRGRKAGRRGHAAAAGHRAPGRSLGRSRADFRADFAAAARVEAGARRPAVGSARSARQRGNKRSTTGSSASATSSCPRVDRCRSWSQKGGTGSAAKVGVRSTTSIPAARTPARKFAH